MTQGHDAHDAQRVIHNGQLIDPVRPHHFDGLGDRHRRRHSDGRGQVEVHRRLVRPPLEVGSWWPVHEQPTTDVVLDEP